MKYILVKDRWGEDIVMAVNRYIAEGYTPLGGVAIIQSEDGDMTYVQAMVKNDNDI